MAALLSLLVFFILNFLVALNAHDDWPCEGGEEINNDPPPTIPRKFHALIETVFSYELEGVKFNTYSLDYDGPGNRVAIADVGSSGYGKRAQHVIDYSLNQAFLIITGKDQSCEVIRPAEIDTNKMFGNFPGVFDPVGPGQIFDAGQFFGMVNLDRVGYIGKRPLTNGLYCDVWVYCTPGTNNNTRNVFVYWSDMPTDSAEKRIMAVIWRQRNAAIDEASNMSMTVAHFQPDYLNLDAFQVPKGDACKGVNSKPFPEILTETVFRFKMEIHIPENKYIMFSDNWIDMVNGFARTTLDMPLSPFSNGISVSTVDYWRKVLFIQDNDQPDGCKVYPINQKIGSIESISNFHSLSLENVSLFFKPPGVQWMYVGKQYHRNISTDVWQAKRTDWPLDQKVTSTWEWHVAKISEYQSQNDKFIKVDQITPVHLRIDILEAGPGASLAKGSTLLFHLYDFKLYEGGTNDLYEFDITNCYREDWKQHIQFRVTIADQKKTALDRYVRDPSFLLQWQVTLADYLDINMLRISQLETYVNDNAEVVIRFWLLDKHPEIPSEEKSKDLIQVREGLSDIINNRKDYPFLDTMGNPIVGSLQDVAIECPTESTLSPHTTLPNTPPTQTTNIRTPAEHTFSGGAMAGIGIGLFLIGMTTGGSVTLLMVLKNVDLCVRLYGKKW